jgi:hypothetical protein
MKYVIDLERVNELTAPHPGDNSNSYQPTAVFSVSKMLIKKWIEIWESRTDRNQSDDRVQSAFESLRYNKILLTEADLRDRKLDNLIDESGKV